MSVYAIRNTATSAVLGTFEAETEEAALAMLSDRLGQKKFNDIEVEDVSSDWMTDGADGNAKGYGYRGWNGGSNVREVYADFGMEEEDELSHDQRRIAELNNLDDDFLAIVDNRIEAHIDEQIRSIVSMSRRSTETLYKSTDLPTFGGDPIDAENVHSLDADSKLVHNESGWQQVAR